MTCYKKVSHTKPFLFTEVFFEQFFQNFKRTKNDLGANFSTFILILSNSSYEETSETLYFTVKTSNRREKCVCDKNVSQSVTVTHLVTNDGPVRYLSEM